MPDSNAPSSRSRLERFEDRLRTGATRSRLVAGVRTLARYVRHSWCYRWLTTEPDPDVVVIDLRETYTVGPVIRLLDRCLEHLARASDSSRAVEIGRQLDSRFRHRPLRVLGAAALATVLVSMVLTAVLGRLGPIRLAFHVAIAVLSLLGLRSDRTLEAVTDTRTWQTIAAAVEPPEPPESTTDRGANGPQSEPDEADE